jgi:outer membrane protein assembly factor BamD (BamD/ComL family)
MGRKQIRRRKHLLFLVAGLIFILFSGCGSLEQFLKDFSQKGALTESSPSSSAGKVDAQKDKNSESSKAGLLEAKKLFRNGEYEAAFREYQKVVVLLNKKPPADEALFFMGLILAYPENPRKDFRRSIELMRNVISDFPLSYYYEPAKAWLGVLQENEKLSRTSEKVHQEKETLAKELERLSRAHDKTVKDYEKIVRENERLNKMMEEYKQVDIEMEGRKRERGR